MNKSCAIFLHLFYAHLYDEIVERLNAIPFKFNLYVNLVAKHTEHLSYDIQHVFPDAFVLISPNNGMDPGGNLRLLNFWLEFGQEEEFIIFLHSKGKAIGSCTEEKVRETDELRNLLWSIVSPEKAPQIEQIFAEEPNVGMIGVEEWHRFPGRAHGDPIPECKFYTELLHLNNYDTGNFGFCAGTMFWVRSKIFRKVFENVDILKLVDELPPSDTGGRTHALERVFGYCVLSENFLIKGMSITPTLKGAGFHREEGE